MIQVLCQILQTDSLVDVQAWLVSASDQGNNELKDQLNLFRKRELDAVVMETMLKN
jgi:hypothetical protein